LNELPAHHRLVHALLGGETLPQRTKNEAEVTREYDVEKWGGLRREVERTGRGFSFSEVDRVHAAEFGDCVSVRGDVLTVERLSEATKRFRRLVAAELRSLMPASALVELGAGYGGMFFPVVAALREPPPRLIALEFAQSGRDLLSRIASAEGYEVTVGPCDLGAPVVTPVSIPHGAVLFTCFAAHYVPMLSQDLVQALCAMRPKAVVHLEPLVHPELQDTTLGLLRRRYLQANDYNRNLLDVLVEAERAGRIRIDAVDPNWFGVNPLLPASRVVWSPA
jgi:hypothetical protein